MELFRARTPCLLYPVGVMRRLTALGVAAALVTPSLLAVRPLRHHHDLVAGQGDAGFRDGSFTNALFRDPRGLAVDGGGRRLFVADRGNHRIRVVDLAAGNRVTTIAGTGDAGHADGPLSEARFDHPTLVVWLPPDRLVVHDRGTSLLRVVDLAQGRVTRVDTGSSTEPVWGLLADASGGAVLFSQPAAGTVRRVDLGSGSVTTLLSRTPLVPRPGPLAYFRGHLVVADLGGAVATIGRDPGSPRLETRLPPAEPLVALAAAGDTLYGTKASSNGVVRVLPATEGLGLLSVWGRPVTTMPKGAGPARFLDFDREAPGGLVSLPGEPQRLVVSVAARQAIFGLTDLGFDRLADSRVRSPKGLTDFAYPERKAPGTQRILLVGDSRTFLSGDRDRRDATPGSPAGSPGFFDNRMRTLPKQLELLLETTAALDDRAMRFEVLSVGRTSDEPAFLWPAYEIPAIARKFDVDVVLFLALTQMGFSAWFQRPITAEGIPAAALDSEFLMLPWKEKLKGPARTFFSACAAKGWARPVSETQVQFEGFEKLTSDPALLDQLTVLMGKPLALLSQRLGEGAKPIRLEIAFCPVGRFGAIDPYRSLWTGVGRRYAIPVRDLTEPFVALRPTYYPMSEEGDEELDHFVGEAMPVLATLLARDILRAPQAAPRARNHRK